MLMVSLGQEFGKAQPEWSVSSPCFWGLPREGLKTGGKVIARIAVTWKCVLTPLAAHLQLWARTLVHGLLSLVALEFLHDDLEL